jgi:hypothetical protein
MLEKVVDALLTAVEKNPDLVLKILQLLLDHETANPGSLAALGRSFRQPTPPQS